MKYRVSIVALILIMVNTSQINAGPFAATGDLLLRHDLQLLNDSGVINIPLTSWPIVLGDVGVALDTVDSGDLNGPTGLAFERLRARVDRELDIGAFDYSFSLSGASEPRVTRTFENTPRENGELNAEISWLGERFSINLAGTFVSNPFDAERLRPDGSYVAMALGNWLLSAGWQDRWYGPGKDGSLILSGNARPAPGLMLQRSISTPFETRWLRWIGPWTMTTFMSQLDDARTVNDAWLFGIRGSFRPFNNLEFGISRTAQWCGDNRPCDFPTFGDLLIGNDNRGVNVPVADEPGNQLGGFDLRWVLPGDVPAAVYMQWIGEDGRGGGGAIGSWMRQLGVEFWGEFGALAHRTHFEVSDSMCREGGFGFSDDKPNCAYEHSIYRTGYRYERRAIGHFADGDSLSYSIGSTLVQSAGHTWNVVLRYMDINHKGQPNPGHTLSSTPTEQMDLQLSHHRMTRIGRLYFGVGYQHVDDIASARTRSDITGFLQWSSQ